MSKLATLSEFSWINNRLPSTSSPIKVENKLSASYASSIFTLSKGEKTAKDVEKAIQNVYSKTEIEFNTYVCKINTEGIKII